MDFWYVVKNVAGQYAEGSHYWVGRQQEADFFSRREDAERHVAENPGVGARVVRLRRGDPMVTLRFLSEADRHYFLSQLSDGFGENFVELDWPEGVALWDADVVDVKVIRDE